MKLIVLLVGAVSCSVSAVNSLQYHQALRSIPSLAPHLTNHQASTKTEITHYDNCEKNFTHNELFALQKRFLDNFVAPNNTVQVRSSALDLRSSIQTHKY